MVTMKPATHKLEVGAVRSVVMASIEAVSVGDIPDHVVACKLKTLTMLTFIVSKKNRPFLEAVRLGITLIQAVGVVMNLF
jgi:hypothetical protein